MTESLDLRDDIGRLIGFLDEGWQIERPVLQRTVLHGSDGGQYLFEIILRLNGDWVVIALCDDPSVDAWLHASGVDVLCI